MWQAKFLSTGKVLRCDTLHGSLFTGDKETKVNMVECDSSVTYKLNKDMINIKTGKSDFYFKIKVQKEKGFELNAVTADVFNKK